MLLKALILLLAALVVAVQAGGYGRNEEARLVKVKNIWEPTIVHPTRRHYKKRVTASKSRRDKYEQVNTRTLTKVGQKIVTSDEYVKDNVHVEYPLKVLNVKHHNNHLTVKNIYPKHKNLYVNTWKTVIKPQEGRTDSYSNSESYKKVVHPTQVVNREKSVNKGTKVEPVQWVEVGNSYGRNNGGQNNGGYNNREENGGRNNGGYNNREENDWAED